MVTAWIVASVGRLIVLVATGLVSPGALDAPDVHRGRVIPVEAAQPAEPARRPDTAAFEGGWIRGDVARQQ